MIANVEKKIYLVWQEANHSRRYVVGELVRKPEGTYIFHYLHGKDLEEAKKRGFSNYPAFPDLSREYHENVIESFSMRLPARSRTDFSELLGYWEIKDEKISDFDLLSITGGQLPTDCFEFVDPHMEKRPAYFLTELAGFVHCLKDDKELRSLVMGSPVELQREPTNRQDACAVKVIYRGKTIGYIKRGHCQTVSEELARGKSVNAMLRNIDANGVVNSVLLQVEIPA
ncbi:MAG: HIRAN domain-containing protein [Candidatus Omnitrophota bacterium]